MGDYKQVAALKKELDDLQKELDFLRTPATNASIGSSEPGELSLGPSAIASPILSPSRGSPTMVGATSAEENAGPKSASPKSADWPKTGGRRTEEEVKISSFTLDHKDGGSSQSSNEAESDTSAVVVEAEDGQEKEVEADQ